MRRRKGLLALLRQVRLEAGMHQAEVASKLGKPQSFVSNYESGERRLDLLELQMVCEVLGVPVVEFVGRFDKEQALKVGSGRSSKLPVRSRYAPS